MLCSLNMQNDTHDVQYHSNCLSLHHSICCCYCSLSPVNCGMPNRPVNGSIQTPQSTLGGSVVEFGCAPGFIPAERMMATCTLNGTWSPDPGTLMCNGETTVCADTYARNFIYMYARQVPCRLYIWIP